MRTLAITGANEESPGKVPPTASLDWPAGHGRTGLQDGGGRPALVSARGGRPRAAPLHARARARRCGCERDQEDEIAFWRAARAAVARGAAAARRIRRAADRHGRRAAALAPCLARAA